MFKKIKANKMSLAKRNPVCGIGINDAWYITTNCPIYGKWRAMISRCYSIKVQKHNPTYIDCTVCSEWLIFSNFRDWMESKEYKGMHLDKDILYQGNKIYSPENCMLVTPQINTLFNDCNVVMGNLPQGVTLHIDGRFRVFCRDNSNEKHIGLFDTVKQASEAYKTAKYKVIKKEAEKQKEPLRSAMLAYKIN